MHNKIRRLTAVLCSLALIFTLGTAAMADEDSAAADVQDTAVTETVANSETTTENSASTTENSADSTDTAVSTEGSTAQESAADSLETDTDTTGTQEAADSDNTADSSETEDGTETGADDDDGTDAETEAENETETETDAEESRESDEAETAADAASSESGDADVSGSSSSSASTSSTSTSSSSARYTVSEPEGDTHELYLTQLESDTCTLASAAMLIRNYMYLNGSDLWQEFGEADIRSAAWDDGLRESFTYTYGDYTVSVAKVSLSSPSVEELKALLDKHPEGIVLYCGNAPHAVLLLDYEGDVFYCADPASLCSGKRIALEDSWLSSYYQGQDEILKNVTSYWYITSAVSPLEDSGLYWAWDGSTLTISGAGSLTDDGVIGTAPWDRYKDYVTQIIIEEGVVNVPSYAFYNYSSLTAVTLPDTLETIGTRAFYGCESLTALVIPDGVYEIGQYAFALCTGLTELTIPAGVTVIQKGLCYCCSSLISLTISQGVETLEASIIYGAALTDIALPASVTSIAAKAFQRCESLTTVYYASQDTLSLLEDAVFIGEVVFLPADKNEESASEQPAAEDASATDQEVLAEEAPSGESDTSSESGR
ncbi:MAG: leucine-rich repeat protein [Oscillospiraceae bacterium]|nr:leucine-rich repeat protein [Oscillospiraceae bacterium]